MATLRVSTARVSVHSDRCITEARKGTGCRMMICGYFRHAVQVFGDVRNGAQRARNRASLLWLVSGPEAGSGLGGQVVSASRLSTGQ